MNERLHWTEGNTEAFRYKVAYDFVNQVEFTMQDQNLKQNELAARLNVTPGRVSQFFNNPGNMSLKSMVEWARVLGRKVAVVLYDDGDTRNANGPIHSEVFRLCWERLGKPRQVYDVEDPAVRTEDSGDIGNVRGEVDSAVKPSNYDADNVTGTAVVTAGKKDLSRGTDENLALAA